MIKRKIISNISYSRIGFKNLFIILRLYYSEREIISIKEISIKIFIAFVNFKLIGRIDKDKSKNIYFNDIKNFYRRFFCTVNLKITFNLFKNHLISIYSIILILRFFKYLFELYL